MKFYDFDDWLVDERAKEILEHADLSGFHFLPVKNGRVGSDIKNMYQLVVDEVMPPSLDFDKMIIKETVVCPECGGISRVLYGGTPFYVDKTVLSQQTADIIKTAEYFGAGIPSQTVLISHKFFAAQKKEKIDGDLIYSDVVNTDAGS